MLGNPHRPARDRAKRSFRPSLDRVDGTLETRLALSGTGAVMQPIAVAVQPKMSAVQNWNRPASWAFIGGPWASQVTSPLANALASAFGAKGAKIPPIGSLDTWTVTDSGVSMSAGTGLQQAGNSVGGLSIAFNSGGAPTLTVTSSDGSPPVALSASTATKNSISFKGTAPLTTTQNGTVADTQTVPVTVTLTKTSATRFTMNFTVQNMKRSYTLMSYHAQRPIR